MIDLSAEHGNARFAAALRRDRERADHDPATERWLLIEDPDHARDGAHLSWDTYLGPDHVRVLMHWLDAFAIPDWFLTDDDELVRTAADRDRACLARLGITDHDVDLVRLGRYNAQDHVLARCYPVPERHRPRVLLDLGPGHGRLANLALGPGSDTQTLIAVDAIPGPYLSQRAYYAGLGLRVADYLDRGDDLDVAVAAESHDVVHLPTWRLDLVPDAAVDMVAAVQVLRELPAEVVPWLLAEVRRVLRPGGALYVRDHAAGHTPNGLDLDEVLARSGFDLEFAPRVTDLVDITGLPRVWRSRA